MILKTHLEDLKIIGFYLGKIILGLAMTMAIPLLAAFFFQEANPFLDFFIGIEISVVAGLLLIKTCQTDKDLNWMQGMIVVSLSWVVVMLLGAVPLYLSGHWKSFLDACFEAMSGFATTGLSLVQDLDHLSYAHNLWRHLMMFLGGQGIVVIALPFLCGVLAVPSKCMWVRPDEKIMPNVINTSRFIWLVSIVYLILGTLSLGVAGICGGMRPVNAFFHGACIFMTAFDTGGFAPQSQSILYYHSFAFEIITVVFMVLGALNFKLHYHLWIGNRKELVKNIETRTFFVTVLATFALVAVGLTQAQAYPKAMMLFRKGFYQLISGHTGTGFQTIYAQQFGSDWHPLALCGVILAMALGGAVCSTTGAIKMLRIGIILKAFKEDLKRIIMPERAIIVEKFHHIREVFLEDKLVRSALMVTLAYIILYGVGALAGMFYGYPFLKSLFESTSAAANVGLSCGITAVTMPVMLKVIYILQMWAGRLEFMSVFTILGFIFASVKGK